MLQSVETITPEAAAALLGANDMNRPLKRHAVEHYARAMKRGEWALNGEAIKIADDGTLLDGQHRLKAVISSGIPITTAVVRGLPKAAFATLDDGFKRLASDVLAIKGEKNTNVLSAGARAIIRLNTSSYGLSRVTTTQVLKCVDAHPLLKWWSAQFNSSPARRFMGAPFVGVLTLGHEKHGQELVHQFFLQVADGVGLTKTDPAYVLRERFMSIRAGNLITQDFKLALMVKAMNAHTSGRKIANLRFGADEAFPSVL